MLFFLSFFFFFRPIDSTPKRRNVKQTFRWTFIEGCKFKIEIFHCSSRIGCTHDSTCEGRVLNTSRTSIPSVLRNVGRSGQESGDFVMSGNCEIETNCNTGGAIPKYFSIPTGGVACSRRNRKRAAPPDLHPKSLSKKKKEVVMSRGWRHFSLSWNRPSTFFAVFRQKCTLGGLFVLQASSSSQNDYYISSTTSFLDSTFSDWITLPRFHPRRSAVLVAETRERRQALVKSRASTHVDNSIHPLTQEISRVYDSSVERPPSPIEQIPPLLLLSPYG